MIQVRCSICDQAFEADDTSAGQSEFCPACGALNDVPPLDPSVLPAEPVFQPHVHAPDEAERGLPGILWWCMATAAVAAFLVACWFLFAPSWESQHLQALADAVAQADALMNAGDFAGAAKQYHVPLLIVGHRTIESDYLRDLLARARRGELDALYRLNAKPAPVPSTATSQPRPPLADLELTNHDAIRNFQRATEGFGHFVGDRPVLFQDPSGHWRRRRYIVWDVTCQLQPQTDPPQMMLNYTCGFRTTILHDQQNGAMADMDFSVAQNIGAVHCQTLFVLRGSKWIIVHRDRDDEPARTMPLEDVYGMEDIAFEASR